MSERIQAVIPTKLAKDIEQIIKEENHENTSEFVRYILQDYVIRKQYGLVKASGGI